MPSTLDVGQFAAEWEKDRLFSADATQYKIHSGVKSWMLGPLNKWLSFSDRGTIPGGHQRSAPSAMKNDPADHPGWIPWMLFGMETLNIDEGSWLSFLRKDRFFDSVHIGGDRLSIDDPRIWEAISPSLELVNRTFTALLEEEHPL